MFHPDGPSLMDLTRQALSSTDRGYDLLAPRFDHTPFRTPDDLLDQLLPYLEGDGTLQRGLDLCTGTGAALPRLAAVCREEVLGLDRSAGMLAQARQHCREGHPRVHVARQDALELDADGVFDLVTCFGAHGHILPDDQLPLARRIHRALVPGGRYICLTADMPGPTQVAWWLARGFNATMRVRNALIRPPFIMYYLLFTTERAIEVLSEAGFDVHLDRDVLSRPYRRLHVLTATRPQS